MHRFQWPAIHLTIAALAATTLPLAVPNAAKANDYEFCSRRLLEAGIEVENAATACARALHPDQTASCVVNITNTTALAPEEVLLACARDRRPQETATCVTDIHRELELTDSELVLESCGLSVLPLSYSDCVVGLDRTAELGLEESIGYCISAGYEPEDVAPTFIFTR